MQTQLTHSLQSPAKPCSTRPPPPPVRREPLATPLATYGAPGDRRSPWRPKEPLATEGARAPYRVSIQVLTQSKWKTFWLVVLMFHPGQASSLQGSLGMVVHTAPVRTSRIHGGRLSKFGPAEYGLDSIYNGRVLR